MGWLIIERTLFEHWIWNDKPFSKGQAWVDLVGLANYVDGKMIYENRLVDGKRGTVYRSMAFLSRRWGWNRKKTRKFLALLESDGMVTIEASTHGTTITIENYEKYQSPRTTKGATKRASKGQPWDKERKKEKKDKEIKEEYRPSDSPEEEGNPWPDDVWED